jgi:putative membrane protein insertion efficiency factor
MNKKYFNYIFILPLILIIRLYILLISPILKTNCRYLPTCSEYAITSLKEYGLMKGGYIALRRISHCHPFGGSGYDPVPKKIRKEV